MGQLFSFANKAFGVVDRAVLAKLPDAARERAFAAAYKAKKTLFPGATRADLGLSPAPTSSGVPRKAATELPEWLRSDIEGLRSEVDPDLFARRLPGPDGWQRTYPLRPEAGRAYRELLGQVGDRPSHLLFAPWLKRGGADLVMLKHLEHLVSCGAAPCLVLTEIGVSPWLSRVPAGATVVEAGGILAGLSPFDRCVVLARLMIQSGAGVIHVGLSQAAWQTLRVFGQAVAETVTVVASLYCDDGKTPTGRPIGFAHDYAARADAHVSSYVSDHQGYLAQLVRLYGIPAGKMRAAYVPTTPSSQRPSYGAKVVLWAGRFDPQKRPDLLVEIAKLLPDFDFEVWGAAALSGDKSAMRRLSGMGNVKLRGAYDGFDALPVPSSGVFLHTSLWDGLPNALLEAGARAMPVVASGVGGIGELIGPRTGWLVARDDAAAYAGAIREAQDAAEARRRGSALQALVAERHTEERFAEAMAAVPGYLPR